MKQQGSFCKLTVSGIIKQVKISVLTPSFNSVKYIQRAIESVLAQHYANFEHIIIDGGSTDGTVEILKQFPHLIWESAPDRGQSDAMNKAFKASSGELIVYLNADDEIESGTFRQIVQVFQENKQLDLLVGDIRISRPDRVTIQHPSISLEKILNLRKPKFPFNPVGYYYRRSLQLRIGEFPITNHFTMDYWFLLRAYKIATLKKVDQVLGTFHFDGLNKSSQKERSRLELIRERNNFVTTNLFSPACWQFRIKRFVNLDNIE